MSNYKDLFTNDLAETSLVTALTRYRNIRIQQEATDRLPAEIEAGLADPDPGYVYRHREVFCRHHFVMLYAAQNDCVPLFKIRIEELGDKEFSFEGRPIPLEFFLESAAINNAANVIRYLMPYISNVNFTPNEMNCTPLYWAAQSGHKEAVEAILEYPGLDIEAMDDEDVTPLMRAFYSGKYEVAEILLNAGAKLNDNLIVWACQSENNVLMDIIFRHVNDFNFTGPETGITPLQAAITAKDGNAVARLLGSGAKAGMLSGKQYEDKWSGKIYPEGIDAHAYAVILGEESIKDILSKV